MADSYSKEEWDNLFVGHGPQVNFLFANLFALLASSDEFKREYIRQFPKVFEGIKNYGFPEDFLTVFPKARELTNLTLNDPPLENIDTVVSYTEEDELLLKSMGIILTKEPQHD